MVWIAGQTVTGSSTQVVTFSSIPQTFSHLQLRVSNIFAVSGTGYFVGMQFNGDTNNNYAFHRLYGNGSSAGSNGFATGSYPYITTYGGAVQQLAASTYPSIFVTDVLDYTSTNKQKTARSIYGQDANGTGEVGLASGVWLPASPVAITSLALTMYVANFAVGTRLDLYGITTSQVTGA